MAGVGVGVGVGVEVNKGEGAVNYLSGNWGMWAGGGGGWWVFLSWGRVRVKQ